MRQLFSGLFQEADSHTNRSRKQPAETEGTQRQVVGQCSHRAQRQGGGDALQGRQPNGPAVNTAALEPPGQERQKDEDDGSRVDGVEDGDRELEDTCQPDVGQQHTGQGKESGPPGVGNFRPELVEILAHARDEAHAGVEAGDDKDGRQQHLSHPAKQGVGQQGEGLGTRLTAGERGPRNAADVGEHGVDHRKQPGGEEPGPDGAPLHLPGFGHTEGLDVQRNDRPEIQPGQSVDMHKTLVAVLAFGVNSGAYVAEIVRSGIMSVDNGQFEAGRSLGLSYRQTMISIVLPQAFKTVLPALANECIVLLKETSVAGYIAIQDLTKGGDIIRSQTFSAFMPLITVALIYLIMVVVLTHLVGKLERRLSQSDRR